jgi:hypothetical protein
MSLKDRSLFVRNTIPQLLNPVGIKAKSKNLKASDEDPKKGLFKPNSGLTVHLSRDTG